jgi:hypothetical protein
MSYLYQKVHFYFTGVFQNFRFSHKCYTDIRSLKTIGLFEKPTNEHF